ncbi:MAG: RidA family protein [Alphaproteobacteria bacterium]
MTIQRFDTNARMSKTVIYNGLHIFCGQTATDRSQDVKGQTKQCLEKIEALLSQHGMDKDNLLQATIFVRDIKDFDAMNEVWDNWVNEGHAPARACLEARAAKEDILVEILATAGK